MIEYYLMIVGATILYSIQFIFTKLYQCKKGSTFFYSMIFGAVSGISAFVFLFVLNRGNVEFTPFSFWIALAFAVDVTLCTIFGAKTLSRANLSVYSLFMMLGGMILPVLYGLTLGESFTVMKALAIVSMIIAMICPLKKEEGKKTDVFTIICFIAIFITNGMTGVLTFAHQRAGQETVSPNGLVMLYNLCRMAICLLLILGVYIYGKTKNAEVLQVSGALESKREQSKKRDWLIAITASVGYSLVNGTAMLLTTITAKSVDAGVQSTIVTGGVMLLSAISGMFFGEKSTVRTWLGMFFAVLGTVLIVL